MRDHATPNDVVQSLWIGECLTAMERMAIQSFLTHGHDFHLYCYDHVEGVPRGAQVKDGNSVLPSSRIFGYRDGFAKGSMAAFSNFFRYKLLLDRGGWWVDTDVVCLRPFDFRDQRLWASERTDPPSQPIVSTSVIKAPAGDELMAWAWQACQQMDPSRIMFGDIGPRLLQVGVDALGVQAFMRPHICFNPIPSFEWQTLLDAATPIVLPEETYGVHLWNQMWSAHSVDKNGSFRPQCFYEQLKRRFACR